MNVSRHQSAVVGRLWPWFVVLLLASSSSAAADSVYVGKVIHISDGDTLTMLVGSERRKIRLAEIATPDLAQPHGKQARKALGDLVFNRTVRVVEVDRDRYGRIVGRVYLDNLNVNAEMVERGHAWVYRKTVRDQTLFGLEATAKAEKRGLWASDVATPPWEWRHSQRTVGSKPVPSNFSGAVIANRRSRIYHLPGCPSYGAVSEKYRILYLSRGAAEADGYRLAGTCAE